mmetsp:Transcript_397/g.1747  ORF Transcript_397/g.1747 Transcript_397/m.1747 type:complete len:413 (-) Transcript_397:285-1523(-)
MAPFRRPVAACALAGAAGAVAEALAADAGGTSSGSASRPVFAPVLPRVEMVVHGWAVARFGHFWTISPAAWVPWRPGHHDRVPCAVPSQDNTVGSSFCRPVNGTRDGVAGVWMVPETGSSSYVVAELTEVPIIEAAKLYYGTDPDVARLHDRAGVNAVLWRQGLFPSVQCVQTCSDCFGDGDLQMGWVLRGILPRSIRIVNIGCRDLGPDDPTHTLIRDHEGVIDGFCVDLWPEKLALARRWLQLVGAKARRLAVVQAKVRPGDAARWVLDEPPESAQEDVDVGGAPALILKVDIDSHDEAVVRESLDALRAAGRPLPVAIVVEYDARTASVPLENSKCTQPSLSYWVAALGARGYMLYKATQRDLLFLEPGLAEAAAQRDFLRLPLDEFACYFLLRHHQISTRPWVFCKRT